MTDKPTVGRIVHFKHTGKSGLETEPAIITRVHSDMCVSLYVMPFDGVARAVTSVMQEGQGGDRSWAWPLRAPLTHYVGEKA